MKYLKIYENFKNEFKSIKNIDEDKIEINIENLCNEMEEHDNEGEIKDKYSISFVDYFDDLVKNKYVTYHNVDTNEFHGGIVIDTIFNDGYQDAESLISLQFELNNGLFEYVDITAPIVIDNVRTDSEKFGI